ncbi:hypothetical protein LY76DRAFT_336171 [Colletotrichum caudatum]|nr:hypothetical protein LY76DRAFT_336171 [Colletotrichum caudatum]
MDSFPGYDFHQGQEENFYRRPQRRHPETTFTNNRSSLFPKRPPVLSHPQSKIVTSQNRGPWGAIATFPLVVLAVSLLIIVTVVFSLKTPSPSGVRT